MSGALLSFAQIAKRARRFMRDTNPSDYAISSREMGELVGGVYEDWHSKIGQDHLQLSLSLAANTDPPNYLLTSGADPERIWDVRRAEDGYSIQRVAWGQLLNIRAGIISPVASQASYYAFYRDPSAGLYIGIDNVLSQTRTLELMIQTGRLSVENLGNSYNDTDSVYGLDYMDIAGLCMAIAAQGCQMMSAQQREARGITPDWISRLETQGVKALRAAESRAFFRKMGEAIPTYVYSGRL